MLTFRPYVCKCVKAPGPLEARAAPRALPISYNADSYSRVYNYPDLSTNTTQVIAVISLGGGLYPNDASTYWTSIGIPLADQPKVVIIPLLGARNTPNANDGGATYENALDVQIIGANCASAKTTILFYLAPNSFNGFYSAFNSAINNPVRVNGVRLRPSVISCSWGAPEANFGSANLSRFNTLFATAAARNINICCASGDHGSSDGLQGLNLDFPSSSPNVVACGGTTLTAPNLTWDASTNEVGWTGSGGGLSGTFPRPSYQTSLGFNATRRASPDIAMNADPYTGIRIRVNGRIYVFGGTSCVSPAMSAFIARTGTTKFVTPLLYATGPRTTTAGAYNDITAGYNGASPSSTTYRAGSGYDRVTGLGSINGKGLKPFVV